ncbi:MAG: 50S ribosomal protein L15 [Patescibacteria group bacterium]
MDLTHLPTLIRRPKKRIGRGHGSGKNKTSGRGTKGQKARGSMPRGFEGGQSPITKRLPYLRGKGRNQSQKPKAFPLPVTNLNALPKGTVVTLETLKKYHMIDERVARVKLLDGGEVSVTLTVKVPCSATAKKAILKAGGSVE